MKTRADLMRDLKNGAGLKMVKWNGKPVEDCITTVGSSRADWLRLVSGEFRSVCKVQTNSIQLLASDGKKSWLDLPNASQIEYDGQTLKVYRVGVRGVNASEQALLDEWKKITDTETYKKQAEYDMMTDGSTTYWQEKKFFEVNGMPWLFTGEGNGLKRVQPLADGTIQIRDNSLRGELDFEYEVKKL